MAGVQCRAMQRARHDTVTMQSHNSKYDVLVLGAAQCKHEQHLNLKKNLFCHSAAELEFGNGIGDKYILEAMDFL